MEDDIDDSANSNWELLNDSDNDEELEDMELEDNKIKECAYFLKYEEADDVDETIFTLSDIDEMKNRERVTMVRNNRGCYR